MRDYLRVGVPSGLTFHRQRNRSTLFTSRLRFHGHRDTARSFFRSLDRGADDPTN